MELSTSASSTPASALRSPSQKSADALEQDSVQPPSVTLPDSSRLHGFIHPTPANSQNAAMSSRLWFRQPSVVWYRGHDLRVEDHPALLAAAQRGGPVVPLFIWDELNTGGAGRKFGSAKQWWLKKSLAALSRDLTNLGVSLVLRRGEAEAELRKFLLEIQADAVFWNRCYEPELLYRDEELRDSLLRVGLTAESFKAELLVEPWELSDLPIASVPPEASDNEPTSELSSSQTRPAVQFQTFHSYMRAWMSLPPPPQPFPSPSRLISISSNVRSLSLDELGLTVPQEIDWNLSQIWTPGSAKALFTLETFLHEVFPAFGEERCRRDYCGTSRLSPHVKFGELSPRRLYHAARVRVSRWDQNFLNASKALVNSAEDASAKARGDARNAAAKAQAAASLRNSMDIQQPSEMHHDRDVSIDNQTAGARSMQTSSDTGPDGAAQYSSLPASSSGNHMQHTCREDVAASAAQADLHARQAHERAVDASNALDATRTSSAAAIQQRQNDRIRKHYDQHGKSAWNCDEDAQMTSDKYDEDDDHAATQSALLPSNTPLEKDGDYDAGNDPSMQSRKQPRLRTKNIAERDLLKSMRRRGRARSDITSGGGSRKGTAITGKVRPARTTARANTSLFSSNNRGPSQPSISRSARAFLKNICLRDFSHHVLFHNRDFDWKPLVAEFAQFPWLTDSNSLTSWKFGNTGYPMVDAGMRELRQTGWIHNGMRFLLASFLTKYLLLPWQGGLSEFYNLLLDGDLASNSLGWQWTAGSNTDAFPFSCLVNPVKVGHLQDPSGQYVRRWIPELTGLPNAYIHQPWKAPADVLSRSGVKLGETYPVRIVDSVAARNRAREAMLVMKQIFAALRPGRELTSSDMDDLLREWPDTLPSCDEDTRHNYSLPDVNLDKGSIVNDFNVASSRIDNNVSQAARESSNWDWCKMGLLPSLWSLLHFDDPPSSLPHPSPDFDQIIAVNTACLTDEAIVLGSDTLTPNMSAESIPVNFQNRDSSEAQGTCTNSEDDQSGNTNSGRPSSNYADFSEESVGDDLAVTAAKVPENAGLCLDPSAFRRIQNNNNNNTLQLSVPVVDELADVEDGIQHKHDEQLSQPVDASMSDALFENYPSRGRQAHQNTSVLDVAHLDNQRSNTAPVSVLGLDTSGNMMDDKFVVHGISSSGPISGELAQGDLSGLRLNPFDSGPGVSHSAPMAENNSHSVFPHQMGFNPFYGMAGAMPVLAAQNLVGHQDSTPIGAHPVAMQGLPGMNYGIFAANGVLDPSMLGLGSFPLIQNPRAGAPGFMQMPHVGMGANGVTGGMPASGPAAFFNHQLGVGVESMQTSNAHASNGADTMLGGLPDDTALGIAHATPFPSANISGSGIEKPSKSSRGIGKSDIASPSLPRSARESAKLNDLNDNMDTVKTSRGKHSRNAGLRSRASQRPKAEKSREKEPAAGPSHEHNSPNRSSSAKPARAQQSVGKRSCNDNESQQVQEAEEDEVITPATREEILKSILDNTEHEFHALGSYIWNHYVLTHNTDREMNKDYVRLCTLKDEFHKECANDKDKLKIYKIKTFFAKILKLKVTGEWDRHGHGGIRGPWVYGIRKRQEAES